MKVTHTCPRVLTFLALCVLLCAPNLAEAKFTEAKHTAWLAAPNSNYAAADQLLNRAWKQIRVLYEKNPEYAAIKAGQQEWVKTGRDAAAVSYSNLPEMDAYTMVTFDRVNELNAYLRPGFSEGDELVYQNPNFGGVLVPEMGPSGFNLLINTANDRATCELTLQPSGPEFNGWQLHEVLSPERAAIEKENNITIEPVNVFISQDGVFVSQFIGLNPEMEGLASRNFCGMVGTFEGLYIKN